MSQKIKIEDYLPKNYNNYIINSIYKSLRSKLPYIPTKFLYTDEGSDLFKNFATSNSQHNSHLEKPVLEDFSKLNKLLNTSNIIVELGAGSFERTLGIITKSKKDTAYSFWAIDFSIEPALTTIKAFHDINPQCDCRIILIDYELSDFSKIIKSNIPNLDILWLGNSCVNMFPKELEKMLIKLKPKSNIHRTLTIGINLSNPSNEQCNEFLYKDEQGFFSEFRKSSLKLIENTFDILVPWKHLHWKTYYNEKINAYLSVFRSDYDWEYNIDSKNHFKFTRDKEIVVGYSHTYTLSKFTELLNRSGWQIKAINSNKDSGYTVLILNPFNI